MLNSTAQSNGDDLATLQKLTEDILNPANPKIALIRQVTELRQLFERRSSLPDVQDLKIGEGETRLDSGLAISPIKAAMCARECFRTIVFIKGLGAAIEAARQTGRPTRVLYAGCGPFASLALPLMSVFSSKQVMFTLIDIHAESLRYARHLIEGFGLAEHVGDYVCADATRYRIPEDALPDVIVSETMNVSLRSEPQVTIARRLLTQAPDALLVPSVITVEACLLHHAKEYAPPITDPDAPFLEPQRDRVYLGKVFELSAQTIKSWDGIDAEVLPAASITIPVPLEPRYEARLLTRIAVYGDHHLLDYESSLNLPQRLPGKPVLKGGEELRFHYRLGSEPGLAFELKSAPW